MFHSVATAGAFWHHSCVKSTSHRIFIKINTPVKTKKGLCVDRVGGKSLIISLLLKIMNVDHCWWKTALFYDFSLRVGANPLQPLRAWPTVFSVVLAGATHNLIPSRGNRMHLKVNGSPVKMEWIFSSVNYQRDGGERRVCWSEWCLMHSIPTSSFLGSSFCVHHASSDQVSIPAGTLLSCTSFLLPLLLFSFPSAFVHDTSIGG